MNKKITEIAIKYQKQMGSVDPHAIIGTIEDAIEAALKTPELIKLFAISNISNQINMKRPEIKDCFKKGTEISYVHKAYKNSHGLFKYIKLLDEYIDYLEEKEDRLLTDMIGMCGKEND